MKRDLAFSDRPASFKGRWSLGHALQISDECARKCEELVNRATREHFSLLELIHTANETLDLTDAEWTNFMYTLGWFHRGVLGQ